MDFLSLVSPSVSLLDVSKPSCDDDDMSLVPNSLLLDYSSTKQSVLLNFSFFPPFESRPLLRIVERSR